MSLGIKGDAGGVHQVRKKRLHVVIRVYLVDCDWDLLPAAAGEGDVDVSFEIDSRVGHRMQVFGDGLRNLHLPAIAYVPVGMNGDEAGMRAIRHLGDNKIF